jgi:hypothetical protein
MGNAHTAADAVLIRSDFEAKLAQTKRLQAKLMEEYRKVPVEDVSLTNSVRVKLESTVTRTTSYERQIADIERGIGQQISANKLVAIDEGGGGAGIFSGWM